jgi:uncharacterized membrane protein YpjA
LGLGFYELRASVTYGTDTKSLQTEPESVLVFVPIWAVASIVITSALAGFLIAKRHNLKKALAVLKGSK